MSSLLRHLSIPLLIAAAVIFSATPVCGQTKPEPELRVNVTAYTGFYRFVDEYGDTCRMTLIRDLYVYPPLRFKNKKQEEFYWRTVRDVRKTLPYAKLCFQTLCETYEYIQTIPDPRQRERHLKQMEKDVVAQY
ncbi:MAG: DUF4294 domain-containing protein, partial [Muribaculaceae bacterium]|nr:DUF4294 domain-containing protein [Muribaculaceae bacterium]